MHAKQRDLKDMRSALHRAASSRLVTLAVNHPPLILPPDPASKSELRHTHTYRRASDKQSSACRWKLTGHLAWGQATTPSVCFGFPLPLPTTAPAVKSSNSIGPTFLVTYYIRHILHACRRRRRRSRRSPHPPWRWLVFLASRHKNRYGMAQAWRAAPTEHAAYARKPAKIVWGQTAFSMLAGYFAYRTSKPPPPPKVCCFSIVSACQYVCESTCITGAVLCSHTHTYPPIHTTHTAACTRLSFCLSTHLCFVFDAF